MNNDKHYQDGFNEGYIAAEYTYLNLLSEARAELAAAYREITALERELG